MKKKIMSVLIVLSALLLCVSCNKQVAEPEKEIVEPESSQMKSICELATMDCYYHNVAKFKEENATGVLLWKKDKRFWVEYSGVVTIGIDATKLKMQIDGSNVSITIPDAKIMDVKVDPESLTKDSFYVDKKSAKIEADDQTYAFKEAQDNMREKASTDTVLLANARENAKDLLKSYVDSIGEATGITYTVKFIDVEDKTTTDTPETETESTTETTAE